MIDRALEVFVPPHGWTSAWAHEDFVGAGNFRQSARALFPGGPSEMVEAFFDLADRRMVQAATAANSGLRLSQRLRAAVAFRLSQHRPHHEAVRLAAALLAVPGNTGLAARCTYRTVDALWSVSGDRSIGTNWYTKRASLGWVYMSTVLFWLQDPGPDDELTMAFFDRRVAALRAVGRWREKLGGRR